MRILFLVGSLRMGGAERVVSRLANYWSQKGFEVCVATVREEASDFYKLEPQISRVAFDLGYSVRYKHQRYIKYFKTIYATGKVIRGFKPDVVISFVTGMNFRALAMKPFFSMPFIISERTNPDRQKINARGARIRRLIYPFADKVVFVSEGVREAYSWLEDEKKSVIYNPAIRLPETAVDRVAEKTIVTLGRLNEVKGHDMLIDAFNRIAGKYPDWRLRIYGEGDYRWNLEQQIAQSPFGDRITLEGFTRTPEECLKSAGLFVLSSRHEGFPNALVEAMSMGLPCISFDCPFGPGELITHGENGLLVEPENMEKLADAMEEMICRPQQREAMGREAATVRKRLDIEAVASEWEKLIGSLIAERS